MPSASYHVAVGDEPEPDVARPPGGVPDDADAALGAAVHVAAALRAEPLQALIAHRRIPAPTAARLVA